MYIENNYRTCKGDTLDIIQNIITYIDTSVLVENQSVESFLVGLIKAYQENNKNIKLKIRTVTSSKKISSYQQGLAFFSRFTTCLLCILNVVRGRDFHHNIETNREVGVFEEFFDHLDIFYGPSRV